MKRFVYMFPHALSCLSCLIQGRTKRIKTLLAEMLAVFVSLTLMHLPLRAQSIPPDIGAGILIGSTNQFGIDLATSALNIKLPARTKIGAIPYLSYFFETNQAYVASGPGYITIYVNDSFSFFDPTSSQIHYSSSSTRCVGSENTYLYSNFSVTDLTGASHPFNLNWKISDTPSCGTTPPPALSTDGSGYTLVPSSSGAYLLYDRNGMSQQGHCYDDGTSCGLVPVITDPDNNTMNPQTDTLNNTVMTVNVSGGYIASYSYPIDASGASAYYTYGYTTYNYHTNFGCPVATDGIFSGVKFLTSITMPDGGKYIFAYEPTPNGNGFTNDGTYFTGRIAKITYPDGGSISYAYSGGNNGFECDTSVVPVLTVTQNDKNGNSQKWVYTNSNTNLTAPDNFVVTRTDPGGNQTVYNFSREYQTQATAYQGGCPTSIGGCNGGGTLLSTVTTCYNAIFSSCATPSATPTLPFSQTDVYTSLNGSSSNLVETKFDTYGNQTEVKRSGTIMGLQCRQRAVCSSIPR